MGLVTEDMNVDLDNYPSAHRKLWMTVGAALGVFAIFYGLGYLVEGAKYVSSPSFYVIKTMVPGGMRTFGGILFAVGLAMVFGSTNPDVFKSHPCTRVFSGISIFITVSMLGSWWITKQVQFSTPWIWILCAAASAGLVKFPPPLRLTNRRKRV